ncbi:hypothetical protein CC1G_00955 [Coprinopsis cinerea okayama7|uniref:Uncharacterized protein n=1 Tax=Coprinopsis cinerea (strain Okayama-7 / 130 / ATCC MYA-4618 / FGSC 9003) TaxID=240176 RepID=A8N980_COPC7|nr:hypothetical protein CC1G_00955 [Coprinopsis cinerea okayama7\|eukprot:XP_001831408.2 hypothetical protein CC1G_00955 [Coprinopsis cinerea okayama7\
MNYSKRSPCRLASPLWVSFDPLDYQPRHTNPLFDRTSGTFLEGVAPNWSFCSLDYFVFLLARINAPGVRHLLGDSVTRNIGTLARRRAVRESLLLLAILQQDLFGSETGLVLGFSNDASLPFVIDPIPLFWATCQKVRTKETATDWICEG